MTRRTPGGNRQTPLGRRPTACGPSLLRKGVIDHIDCNGEVRIDDSSIIAGDISGDKIYISKLAKINGILNANNGVTFLSNTENNTEDKIRRFKSNLDKIEGL